MLSIVKLSDVKGQPTAKLDLPGLLRIGDPIGLHFSIEKQNDNGRTEVLQVNGQFRITAVGFDASGCPSRQLLSVEATGRAPTWRSIKKRVRGARRLSPAVFPKTSV
jgi:hypothetical protein